MIIQNKKLIVLQHAHDEHVGRIGEAMKNDGLDFDTIRPDLGDVVPTTLGTYSGLIVMGGPQSVYEEDKFPYLQLEKKLIRNAIENNRPILGICLGSQMLAEALGARVYAGKSFEIGWKKVVLSPLIKEDKVLGHFPETITPLHWHGDVFDLPPGAHPVGASEVTALQGFSFQQRFYGLLFHIEVTLEQVAAMAAAFPDDLSRGGVSESALLKETPRRIDDLKTASDEAFRRWIALL